MEREDKMATEVPPSNADVTDNADQSATGNKYPENVAPYLFEFP
jgi:hypothetical protein